MLVPITEIHLNSVLFFPSTVGLILPDSSPCPLDYNQFTRPQCSEKRDFLRIQYSSSSPSPPPSSSDSSCFSPKLSRMVHRSSLSSRASFSSIPSVAQSTFRRKQSWRNSAYCASRRGDARPDPSVDTIGTDRRRVRMPRGVRSRSAFRCCALKNDGKEEGSGYSICACRLWTEALPIRSAPNWPKAPHRT